MYGAGIGTGASGIAMFAGIYSANLTLMTVAALAAGALFVTTARNTRRTKASQRP